MNNLSEDIIIIILSFLTKKDILSTSLINKKYYNISNKDEIWSLIIQRDKFNFNLKSYNSLKELYKILHLNDEIKILFDYIDESMNNIEIINMLLNNNKKLLKNILSNKNNNTFYFKFSNYILNYLFKHEDILLQFDNNDIFLMVNYLKFNNKIYHQYCQIIFQNLYIENTILFNLLDSVEQKKIFNYLVRYKYYVNLFKTNLKKNLFNDELLKNNKKTYYELCNHFFKKEDLIIKITSNKTMILIFIDILQDIRFEDQLKNYFSEKELIFMLKYIYFKYNSKKNYVKYINSFCTPSIIKLSKSIFIFNKNNYLFIN